MRALMHLIHMDTTRLGLGQTDGPPGRAAVVVADATGGDDPPAAAVRERAAVARPIAKRNQRGPAHRGLDSSLERQQRR